MHKHLYSFARRLIRHKVRQLLDKYGFTRSDREDLEQDLWLHLLERLQAEGDNLNNPEAFIATIIDSLVVDLIRQRKASKRNAKRLRSLNAQVEDEDNRWVQFSEIIPAAQAGARLGVAQREDTEQVALQEDVAAVLAQLPPNLRDLAERLKHHSITEVARQLGLPRRTLRDAIAKLRQHFAAAGFGENMEFSPPSGPEISSEELIEGPSRSQPE